MLRACASLHLFVALASAGLFPWLPNILISDFRCGIIQLKTGKIVANFDAAPLIGGDANRVTINAPSLTTRTDAYQLVAEHPTTCNNVDWHFVNNANQDIRQWNVRSPVMLSGDTMPVFVNDVEASLSLNGCIVSSLFRIVIHFRYDCRDWMDVPTLGQPGNKAVLSANVSTGLGAVQFRWGYNPMASEPECQIARFFVQAVRAASAPASDDDWGGAGTQRPLQSPASPCPSLGYLDNCGSYDATLEANSADKPLWFWRVVSDSRARGGVDQRSVVVTPTWSFCIRAPPSAPAPQSPAGNAQLLSNTPTLRWAAPSSWGFSCGQATTRGYTVRVYSASSGQLAMSLQVQGLALQQAVVQPLAVGPYKWTVTATGGPESDFAYFSVCVPREPAAPALLSPVAGAPASGTVQLRWAQPDWGTTCDDSNPPSGVWSLYYGYTFPPSTAVHGLTSSSFVIPPEQLLRAETVYWKVTAEANNKMQKSDSASFTMCFDIAPDSPTILSPPQYYVMTSNALNVTWNTMSLGISCQRMNVSYTLDVTTSAGKKTSYSFTLCIPKIPAKPSIVVPTRSQSFVISDQDAGSVGQFSWVTSPGESCIATPPVPMHKVYLTRDQQPSGGPNVVFSDSSANVVFTPPPLTTGTWYLRVVTNNGRDDSPPSDTVSFSVCVHSPPSVPAIVAPAQARYASGTPNVTVQWRQDSWGTPCIGGATNMFFLVLVNGTQAAQTTQFSSSAAQTVLYLTPGSWSYYVVASNGRYNTSSQRRTITYNWVCAPKPAQGPVPDTIKSPHVGSLVTFTWSIPDCGESCINGSTCRSQISVDDFTYDVPANQTAYSMDLGAGPHRWYVTVFNGKTRAKTSGSLFSVCIPGVPTAPRLEDESLYVLPNIDITWPDVNWNDAQSCETHYYSVVLEGQTYVLTDPQLSPRNLSPGWHNITVAAVSGIYKTTRQYSFFACSPRAPSAPKIVAPLSGKRTPPVLLVWDVLDMGDDCSKAENSSYSIAISFPDGTSAQARSTSRSLLFNGTATGTYSWAVTASNGYPGLVSPPSASASFDLCVPKRPLPPVLVSPAQQFMFSRVEAPAMNVSFEWETSALGDLACDSPVRVVLSVTASSGEAVAVVSLPANTAKHVLAVPNGNFTWSVSVLSNYWNVSGSSATTEVMFDWRVDSPGRYCSATAEFTRMEYEVFVGEADSSQAPVLRSTAPGKIKLYEGKYQWYFVAYSADMNGRSETQSFSMCTLASPLPALQQMPRESEHSFVEPNRSFAVVNFSALSTRWLGSSCSSTLLIGRGDSKYSTRGVVPLADTVGRGGPQFHNVRLEVGRWFWSIRVVNQDNMTDLDRDRTSWLYTVCKHPRPPVLTYPLPNMTDRSLQGITLKWDLETDAFGECLLRVDQTVKIILWMDVLPVGTPLNYTMGRMPAFLQDDISPLSRSVVLPQNVTRRNATYVWAITIHNGVEAANSPLWSFTTSALSCQNISCGVGRCNEATLMCRCLNGTEQRGPCLAVADDGDDARSRLAIILGTVLGGSFAIACALLVLLAVRRWRKRSRKLVELESPESKARFATCKPPTTAYDCTEIEQKIEDDPENGFAFALGACAAAQVTETENLAKVLVYAYERRGASRGLVEALIRKEVEDSDSLEVIFRGNSISTKAFKYYSKMVSLSYLWRTFGALLQEILQKEADNDQEKEEQQKAQRKGKMVSMRLYSEGKYEVDPEKLNESEQAADLSVNVLQLCLTTQKFMTQIFLSADDMPPEIKHICWAIKDAMTAKWPDKDEKIIWSSVGAFVFLRLLNVAISVPESYGLLKEPPNEQLRRCLVLVTKVLQCLSTVTLFGEKEKYMTNFNELLQNNFPGLSRFYGKIAAEPGRFSEQAVAIPDALYATCLQSIAAQVKRSAK
eukprot:m51a1_g9537 hypothetical protein (1889) ;mRNA; r:825404-832589